MTNNDSSTITESTGVNSPMPLIGSGVSTVTMELLVISLVGLAGSVFSNGEDRVDVATGDDNIVVPIIMSLVTAVGVMEAVDVGDGTVDEVANSKTNH